MSTSWINVRYSKEHYGVTPRRFLGELIASKRILQFYRESQKRWVTIGIDPVRSSNRPYCGPEKRSR